jgi:hypothetical protein
MDEVRGGAGGKNRPRGGWVTDGRNRREIHRAKDARWRRVAPLRNPTMR